jgi:hypothetical protein
VPVNGALKGQLPWLDKLDETLRHADCFANITDVSFNVGKLIATCLSPARLLELFGRSAIFLAPIMAFGPVINFFKSEFNALLDQFNSRDQYNLSIGRANVAELCPSGRSKCFGIRQADVDGDGRPDTVSLVFDPKYEDCRAYGARVMFASGDSAQGDFCFPGPEEGRANPLTERVSFLGFTDLNRDGKQEIFAKLFVNHQWYIGVLGDREKGNQNVLEQPQFDGLAVGFPLSLTRPFFSDFFSHADYEAGGFHCGKSSDGQARLIVWSVRVSNQDKQYDFTSVTYQLDEADIFAQVPSAFRKKTLPLHDPNTPRRLVAQKSAITCPGLDPLPAAASK